MNNNLVSLAVNRFCLLLEWLAELDAVLARRPENFNRTMTLPEKKQLEGMLERGLGVQRKKATVKKADTKALHKSAPQKRAPRKGKSETGPR